MRDPRADISTGPREEGSPDTRRRRREAAYSSRWTTHLDVWALHIVKPLAGAAVVLLVLTLLVSLGA